MSSCPYCKGTRRIRHKKPGDVTDQFWFDFQGFGHCPLCEARDAGKPSPPWTHMKAADSIELFGVIFIKTKLGKVLMSCLTPDCTSWVDATCFFPKERPKKPDPLLATCRAKGHEVFFQIVDEAKP